MTKFLSHLFILSLSVVFEICVSIYGWGLTPKSWPVIIGVGFFGQAILLFIQLSLEDTE